MKNNKQFVGNLHKFFPSSCAQYGLPTGMPDELELVRFRNQWDFLIYLLHTVANKWVSKRTLLINVNNPPAGDNFLPSSHRPPEPTQHPSRQPHRRPGDRSHREWPPPTCPCLEEFCNFFPAIFGICCQKLKKHSFCHEGRYLFFSFFCSRISLASVCCCRVTDTGCFGHNQRKAASAFFTSYVAEIGNC